MLGAKPFFFILARGHALTGFRGRGREREAWLVVSHLCLDWASTPRPFGFGTRLRPTEPHWPGKTQATVNVQTTHTHTHTHTRFTNDHSSTLTVPHSHQPLGCPCSWWDPPCIRPTRLVRPTAAGPAAELTPPLSPLLRHFTALASRLGISSWKWRRLGISSWKWRPPSKATAPTLVGGAPSAGVSASVLRAA